MAQIFGNEIPDTGRFVSSTWVPAIPEDFRIKCVIMMPDGSQIPDERIRRFALYGVVCANKDVANQITKICLGTTDKPEEVKDLIRLGELVQQYGSKYFHSLEMLDFWGGLMWTLPCEGE